MVAGNRVAQTLLSVQVAWSVVVRPLATERSPQDGIARSDGAGRVPDKGRNDSSPGNDAIITLR